MLTHGVAVLVGAVAAGVGAGIGLPYASHGGTALVTVRRTPLPGGRRGALRLGSRRHRPPSCTAGHECPRSRSIAIVSVPVAFAFAMATATTYVPRVALGSETPVRPRARLSRCCVRGERWSEARGLVPPLDERRRGDPAPRRPLDAVERARPRSRAGGGRLWRAAVRRPRARPERRSRDGARLVRRSRRHRCGLVRRVTTRRHGGHRRDRALDGRRGGDRRGGSRRAHPRGGRGGRDQPGRRRPRLARRRVRTARLDPRTSRLASLLDH